MSIADIKNKFEVINKDLRKMADAFPIEDKETYLSFLAQTLEYATYTTRILALTGANFPLSQTTLASRFIQHATEEKGHDKLLFNDAKALGVDLAQVPLLPEAEAFHKSLYYWIYQGKPAVIMGWVLLLEGFAVLNGPNLYARAEKVYGSKPTSFLRVHTQEDPDHVEKAFGVLNCFSEDELKDVERGLDLYAVLYANIYAAVTVWAKSASSRKAA
jgi:hypothetical protein